MATLLYGPDGQPMLSSGDFDKQAAYADIQKRVRSQATTLTQVWDPKRGKPKPTPVTFDTLRMMANRNEWISAIRKTRKNQIGKIKWSIIPKDEDDDSPGTERLCDEITELFKRPSLKGSRSNSRSWRQFIGEVLDDVLTLDAGCIEKERNGRGWIVAMYPVDGATIRPNIDNRGGFADNAYVQLVDGQITANFGMEDLIYIMDNPQTDVRFAGYGYSPLEHLIVSVTAELFASRYNADYFQKGSVPEGLLNLGEEVAPEDVDAFRLYWMNEIMGKPWAIPIVGGKGVEWMPWRQSNKDMEYSAYQQWLLKKMCAVYQIPPQEVGELEDVNRSTAQDQDTVNQDKSITPILTLLADYFETEIIGVHGQGVGDYVEFKWDLEEEDEQQVLEKFQVLVTQGAATRNEMREALAMEPYDDEGADLLLVTGQLQGLPSEEDIEALSASTQQQQQKEQAQQQMEMSGGTPGTMPWKPGNPQDPQLQAAQREHRQGQAQQTGPVETPQIGKAARTMPSCERCGSPLKARSDATGVRPCSICSEEHAKDTDGTWRSIWKHPHLQKTSDFTPHAESGKEWHKLPHPPKNERELRAHLTKLSGEHGGAWVADNTFGEGRQHHFQNRSAVPIHFRGEAHHLDGLAVGGKWQPWTKGQVVRDQRDWRKSAKDELEDRNPALTEHSDAFEDEFTQASDRLVGKLSDILHLPSPDEQLQLLP